jgi:DNA polymerase
MSQSLFAPPTPSGEDPAATLRRLAEEARGCQRCPLWSGNTQTVFGAGSPGARLVLIGEAPGEQEDRAGRPFVGAAGRLLDEALAAAGLNRDALWITNVVKHRPWVTQAGRKKNRPPKTSEINACRVWLEGELQALRPRLICTLGAVAARWVLGKEFRLSEQRGQWQSSVWAPEVLPTLHPAYVLIQPPETQERVRRQLFADLRAVGERYRALAG